MSRFTLPPQHRGVSHRLSNVFMRTSARLLLAAMILLVLTVWSQFRHVL
ncbi:hypothetical protein [Roseibium album]